MEDLLPLQQLVGVLDHINQGRRVKPQGLARGRQNVPPFWKARDTLAYEALVGNLSFSQIERKVSELDCGVQGEEIRISKNVQALRGLLEVQQPPDYWGELIKPPNGFNAPFSKSGPSVRLRGHLAFMKGRRQTNIFLNSAGRPSRKGETSAQIWHFPTPIFEVAVYFWRNERQRFGRSDWREIIIDTVGCRIIKLELQRAGEAKLLHQRLGSKIDEYWPLWFPNMARLDFEGDDASQGHFDGMWY